MKFCKKAIRKINKRIETLKALPYDKDRDFIIQQLEYLRDSK